MSEKSTIESLEEIIDSQLPKKLQLYHNLFKDTMKLNEMNVYDKLLSYGSEVQSWVSVLAAEQAMLKKLEDLYANGYEDAKHNTKTELGTIFKKDSPNGKSVFTPTTMSILDANPDLANIKKKLEYQRMVVNYVTDCVKTVKEHQWNIKNYISYLEIERK